MAGKINKRILIVDDSMTNLVLLDAVLKTEKYSVRTACSRGIAQRIMKIWCPDLIILDLLMPGRKEGLKFFDLIRNDYRHNNIKVVIVSSLTDKSIIEHTLSKGAADYLIKPVDLKKFNYRIKKIID